jgi:DNA (cytosine-5)-methyltransferase 1
VEARSTSESQLLEATAEVLIEQPKAACADSIETTVDRRITPIECARLMGFENEKRKFRITVSDTQAYKQFGNAVVVPVVEFVAKAMKPFIAAAVAKNTTPSLQEKRARHHLTRPDREAAAVRG